MIRISKIRSRDLTRSAQQRHRTRCLVGIALLATACAQSPPTATAPTATAPVANSSGAGDGACPPAQAKYLSCGNGVRLITYDERLKLQSYCAPIASIEQSTRSFDRSRPIQHLSDGTRAMISGAAGWLLLPKEAQLIEAPAAVTVWWRNRQCTFPSGLRSDLPIKVLPAADAVDGSRSSSDQ